MGCGHHRMKGFIHVEINIGKSKSGPPDILADMTEGVPVSDQTADLIFSRATLEHLTYRELINHLLESNRILKDGGAIRMVVPDFDTFIKEYKKRIYWSDLEKNPDLPNENYVDTFVSRMLYHDHYYLHNFDTLSRALQKTGFINIRQCEPGDTKIEEAREEILKAEVCRHGEIIIEAVKSGKAPTAKRFASVHFKNPIKKFLAEYFNLSLVPHKKRRPMFPCKGWFVEKFKKTQKIDINKIAHRTGTHGKESKPPKHEDKLDLTLT